MNTSTPREPTPRQETPAPRDAGTETEPSRTAGLDREVGDLDDPDAVRDEGALPGRVGGGLAGG